MYEIITYIYIFGVLQGSVLGPILFFMHITDLCRLPIDNNIMTFADGTFICNKKRNRGRNGSKSGTNNAKC